MFHSFPHATAGKALAFALALGLSDAMAQETVPTQVPAQTPPDPAMPVTTPAAPAAAQVWKPKLVAGFKFTQAYFDNWAKGGVDAIAGQLNVDAAAERDRAADNWNNSGKISLGATRIDGDDVRKTVDEFRLESVYTRKVGLWVNPYASLTAQSQFAPGYEYGDVDTVRISGPFDPFFVTQSVGLGWTPVQPLKTRLGAALKETWSGNFRERYLEDPQEGYMVEPGMEFAASYQQTLLNDFLAKSDLLLFSNFEGMKEIDARWDATLAAKVNRFLDVSLNVEVLYDKDISESRQLKESLALGLTYAFL